MTKNFNWRQVSRVIGKLIIIESGSMLLSAGVAFLYHGPDVRALLETVGISLLAALILIGIGAQGSNKMGNREGYFVVGVTWIVFSIFGMLPFVISGYIPNVTNAFFETISGFTTTGASILNDIEALPHGLLFWRSFTQFIGGLGIIAFSLALLPKFSISGIHLYAAETTGPTKDKLYPKIGETAKLLFLIYVILNVAETLLLRLGGMTWFDAICNSFATISTGGFSTKQASIAAWNSPFIQYVIIVFMILSGINFSLYYFAFNRRFDKVKEDEELRNFLRVLIIATLIITFSLIDFSKAQTFKSIEHLWRDSLFTVSSLMTTCGFCTADYMNWKPLTWVILLLLMLTGASAGSTSGGIKMIRIVIAIKASYYQFKRLVHPNAIIPIRYNKSIVHETILIRVLSFTLFYIIIAALGIIILAISGMGFKESIGSMITCLGGVGPGLGMTGPSGNFFAIPTFSKWFLSFIMLTGRLEIYTFLILFTPAFWRK